MNFKKAIYAAAPVLLAGGLYLGGNEAIAKTVTKTITIITKGSLYREVLDSELAMMPNYEDYLNNYFTEKIQVGLAAKYKLYHKTETQTQTLIEVPDDPVITAKTVPAEEPAAEQAPACEHSFSWVEEQEATAEEDAIYVNRCDSCGMVIGSRREPGTAVGRLQQEVMEKIRNAVSAIEAGDDGSQGTKVVVIDTGNWTCFSQRVLDELAKHPSVSLEIHYSYQNTRYVLVIPVGADLEAIRREDGFYGFRYLDSIFGGYEE